MKELKKYIELMNDEDFGKLVKNYFYYMDNQDLPEETDGRARMIFNTTIKSKCDYQIHNTLHKRQMREAK